MYYFSNKFSKITKRRLITFDFGDLKLLELDKFWFFKLIMIKTNFKNQLRRHFSDVITITSPKKVTKITSQNFLFWAPPPSGSM